MEHLPHETPLVATVSVALAFALLGGFAAVRIGLPAIVGYLLAGVAVGPFTPGFVADASLAPQLAEIGIVLLMFGVGVHFSLPDLLAVRGLAVPGAIAQVAAVTALTAGVAALWGWSLAAGLVLGLALSIASTVVLLRAFEERGLVRSAIGKAAIGWLIVEDLLTVLALVLLPLLARNGATAGDVLLPLVVTLGKVALLVAVMLFVGARFVPWLLAQVERTGSRELFTLAVLATALGIAYGAAEVAGVSLALGAFLAGLVVGESELGHRAGEDALPLRDAFAVLFFVSVGMLFDPALLVARPLELVAVVLLVVLAKPLVSLLVVLALRRRLPNVLPGALTLAAGRGQIGEFSFVLAALGVGLGVLPPEAHGLVVAGALISITLNPLLFRAATRWRWPALVALVERR